MKDSLPRSGFCLLLLLLPLGLVGCESSTQWSLSTPDLYVAAPQISPLPEAAEDFEVLYVTSRAVRDSEEHPEDSPTVFSNLLDQNNMHIGKFRARVSQTKQGERQMVQYFDGPIVETQTIPIQQALAVAHWIADEANRRSAEHVLLYAHGYNVSMRQALRHGIQFQSVMPDTLVVVFAWPSMAGLLSYAHDDAMARVVSTRMRDIVGLTLRDGHRYENPPQLWLLGHSTGARILSDAMLGMPIRTALSEEVQDRLKRGGIETHIILAAPDMTTPEFLERFVNREFPPNVQDVTLYFSGEDWALFISSVMRLGIGILGGNVVEQMKTLEIQPVDNITLIDAGPVRDEMLGHSYIIRNPTVLSDLILMVEHDWTVSYAPEQGGTKLRARAMQGSKDRRNLFTLQRNYMDNLDLTQLQAQATEDVDLEEEPEAQTQPAETSVQE